MRIICMFQYIGISICYLNIKIYIFRLPFDSAVAHTANLHLAHPAVTCTDLLKWAQVVSLFKHLEEEGSCLRDPQSPSEQEGGARSEAEALSTTRMKPVGVRDQLEMLIKKHL